jgi:hypothetical protein
MRKLLCIACAALAACACLAGDAYVAQVAMGTNDAASVTFPRIVAGFVDTVYIAASDAAATGEIGVVYQPHYALVNPLDIVATNYAVTGSATLRPRVTGNSTGGGALAATIINAAAGTGSNAVATASMAIPYEPIVLAGESVSVIVQGSTTGVTWRVVLVTR